MKEIIKYFLIVFFNLMLFIYWALENNPYLFTINFVAFCMSLPVLIHEIEEWKK